ETRYRLYFAESEGGDKMEVCGEPEGGAKAGGKEEEAGEEEEEEERDPERAKEIREEKKTQKDHELAECCISWMESAAKGNVTRAQKLLGFCYLEGHGVMSNDKTGAAWLARAAKGGDAEVPP
ncbi:hypothetical protein T484DRAFT_1845953, partial [Baffinella frigidus]